MFAQELAIELKLTIGETAFSVPCGQVKNLAIELNSYGFDVSVDFWLLARVDLLFIPFSEKTLAQAYFLVQAYYNDPSVPPLPIALTGYVYEKGLTEVTIPTVDNIPMLYRHYFIKFCDPATLFWRQHFPSQLFVDKTMTDVIDAHKGDKITITYDFTPLTVQKPILMLGLGESRNSASFYDFLMWYLDAQNGILAYDSLLNAYKIVAAKVDVGEAQPVGDTELASWQVVFPETVRHNVNLLNGYTENADKQEIVNTEVVTGIRKDILVIMPVSDQFSARATLEESRLILREHEVELNFRDYPTITVRPGHLITLAGGNWGVGHFTFSKVYRVWQTSIKATAKGQEALDDQDKSVAGYNVDVTVRLELQAEKYVHRPPFVAPRYPVCVEGKILSEAGAATEETYQIYQEQTTSQDMYKVAIPLWENQNAIVAFTPDFFAGHFYFPAYKNERVLLAFEFESATIAKFLDWRPGGRLPAESQGNHLLMGLKADSQTSFNHVYEDQKPVLNLKRTSAADTQLVQLKEGCMILETKEE